MAAFAREVLAGKSSPGVWYPEEPEAVRDRRLLLDLAAKGADRYLTCIGSRGLGLGCCNACPSAAQVDRDSQLWRVQHGCT